MAAVMPTKLEHRDRIESVRKLLAIRTDKGEIKRFLKKTYGVGARTAEKYLSRARAKLLDETGIPKQEHKAGAYAFYAGMVSDENQEPSIRLKAQERIDKLFGLEAPSKLNVTNQDDEVRGENSMIPSTPELIARMRKRLAEIERGRLPPTARRCDEAPSRPA